MPANETLFAWIGHSDLKNFELGETGPIADGIINLGCRRAVLLYVGREDSLIDTYGRWLRDKTKIENIQIHRGAFSNPQDHDSVTQFAVSIITKWRRAHPNAEMVFHLTPGTPAMASSWIILGLTQYYGTKLIETSREEPRFKIVKLPYKLSKAEFIWGHGRQAGQELERAVSRQTGARYTFEDLFHSCELMRVTIEQAKEIAHLDVSLLILGETGTGKGMLASAMHNWHETRRFKPFISVNCGGLPENLLESELFGHVKGAFTGADATKEGYFEAAQDGTLFLDEIGELGQSGQAKLLRAIEEKTIIRLGDTKERPMEARVICATNRNLRIMVNEGRFREDLFHRLDVLSIEMPPIRRRGEKDLELLISRAIERANHVREKEQAYEPKSLSEDAEEYLKRREWKGNVRELNNAILKATLRVREKEITSAAMRRILGDDNFSQPHNIAAAAQLVIPDNGFRLQDVIDATKRMYLQEALRRAGGNKSEAAKLLGLGSGQSLTNWLKRVGLSTP